MAAIDATLNLNTVINGTEEASAKLNELTGKIDLSASQWRQAGLGLTAVGAAGVLAISSVTEAAMSFEKQMSVVKAITQTTGEEFQTLEEKALSLGASTAFTAEEVAQGMQYLGQAGFTTDEILSSIASTLDLAIAGQVELGRASDITASVLRAFNIDAEDSGHVVDVMSKAIVTSNTDLENYAESMKYLAPTAHAMGISLEEASAIIGIMGDSGEKGSIATRAFGSALTRLTKPTEKMEEMMYALGLSWGTMSATGQKQSKFFDQQTGQFVGLAKTVELLRDSMQGLTQEEQLSALATLFGADAMQEILILMQAGPEAISEYTAALKDSDDYARQLAATQMDNLYGSVELMSGAFDSLKIAVGSELAPIFRALADAMTWLLDVFNNSSEGVKQFVAGFLLFGTAFFVVAGAISLVMGMLPALTLMFNAILAIASAGVGIFTALWAAITGPIGLIVIAVAALIAIIVAVVYNWDWVLSMLKAGWELLKSLFWSGVSWLGGIWNAFWDGVLYYAELAWGFISLAFQLFVDSLVGIWQLGVGFLQSIWDAVWNGIKLTLETVWAGILYFIDLHVQAVNTIINGLIEVLDWLGIDVYAVKDAFVEWATQISDYVSPILSTIADGISWVTDKVGDLIGALKDLGSSDTKISTSGSISGARASGGPVSSGGTYLVGEEGPELFTPNLSGSIIPNSSLGGSNIVNKFYFEGVFGKDAAEEIGDMVVMKLARTSGL